MAARSQFKSIRLIVLIIAGTAMFRCGGNPSERVLNNMGYQSIDADTTTYPMLINDSAAIIYQFGHMTADKGLKLYYDTMAYSPEGFRIDDSIRKKLSLQ
jgi:hypothetical protein